MRSSASRLLFAERIAIEIAKNVAMRFPAIRGLRLKVAPRTSCSELRISAKLLERYALALPAHVLAATGSLVGKRVAEIGPGDHLATGLVMLAAGASSYACLDRFPGEYSNAYAKRWYRAVYEAWPAAFPNLSWPEWLKPEAFPESYPERVRVVRVGVENRIPLPASDVVCSYAVGEHVLDVEAFGRSTRDLTAPGGKAVHVVDFSQHFDWSRYGDSFLFLSISDRAWRWMGSERGLPNRVRYQEFVEALERGGLKIETTDRRISTETPSPARLLPRFRAMPLDSIRTLEATFVCSARC